MNEWSQTTLGDVAKVNPESTPKSWSDELIRYVDIAAVSRDGGIASKSLKKVRFAEAPGRARRRIRSGDVIVSTVRPNLRAFAPVPPSLDGEVASTGFAVLRARADRVTSGFLWCLVSSEAFVEDMIPRCTGTNYPAIRGADVAAFPVSLPSLAEQHRIVDVVAAVDAQIDSLDKDVQRGQQALVRLIADSFDTVSGSAVPIVDLCSLVVGGVWGSPEGESEVDVLALGPRIYTPGTTDFVTTGSPLRSFSAKQVASRVVQPGDIILERSGGSPEQPVGRIVIAGRGLEPCVPTDFQRLVRPDPDLIEPRYLFWRLRHDWHRGLTRAYSRRTTGITNLSVKDYIARPIPVPGRDEQIGLVERADAMNAATRAAVEELATVRAFRRALLTSLLNRDIEIPESYDALLEAAS